MPQFGNIKSYNTEKGAGTIIPEEGGDALPFKKADLQQQAQTPSLDERYSYETVEVDGGNKRAVDLQQQGEESSQQERAPTQQG
ncbi:cold-shock protein [Aurantiacibacter hainanensis]|uniref:cold-shock protein n=1 Tax=Aurantiacibacter hainanensis TaxID=3076114 RepID=UPI0030C66435